MPAPFGLFAVERTSDEIKWHVDVWGNFSNRSVIGYVVEYAQIVSQADLLYVFGGGTGGLYVETFDKSQGKCISRFSTDYPVYWEIADRRERDKP